MKLKYTILFVLILSIMSSNAQEKTTWEKLKIQVLFGDNIGGNAPLPLPEEVRKIKSYNPKFNPQIGFNVIYPINEKWGIGSGLTLDWKGMRVTDRVKYMYTTVTVKGGNGTLTGYFVGDNMTNTNLIYLTLPVYATYEINEKWQVRLGGYFATALKSKFEGNVTDGYIRIGTPTGQKQEIDIATFDFNDDIRKVDLGLLGGANYNVTYRWGLYGHLSWGLLPFFKGNSNPIQFSLHNIFGTIGVTYQLK